MQMQLELVETYGYVQTDIAKPNGAAASKGQGKAQQDAKIENYEEEDDDDDDEEESEGDDDEEESEDDEEEVRKPPPPLPGLISFVPLGT